MTGIRVAKRNQGAPVREFANDRRIQYPPAASVQVLAFGIDPCERIDAKRPHVKPDDRCRVSIHDDATTDRGFRPLDVA